MFHPEHKPISRDEEKKVQEVVVFKDYCKADDS